MERSQSSRPITVIEATKGWKFPDLRELWVQRDLLYLLGRREILVRYQQAVVGVLWAVFQPVFFAVTFAVFLGILAKAPSQAGLPYPLLAISGLVAWFAFSKAVERCTSSTTGYEALITKVYLPRVALPVSSLASPAFDLLIGIVVVLLTGLVYGFVPDIRVLAVIPVCLLLLLFALGVGIWFAALNVKYRDFETLVPTVMLVGLFITPIAYPFDLVPADLQPFYALNPMVGVLEAFRWAMLGLDWPGVYLLVPVIATPVLLVTGLYYFERAQRGFADVI